MEITFSSNKLEYRLTDERQLRRFYGKLADYLMSRISELEAAKSLEDISTAPPPSRHKLTGQYSGCWSITIHKNYKIIVKPVDDYFEERLDSIKSVMIVEIVDYH